MEENPAYEFAILSHPRGAFGHYGLILGVFDVEKISVFRMRWETGGTLQEKLNGSSGTLGSPNFGDACCCPVPHILRNKWVQPLVLCTLSG